MKKLLVYLRYIALIVIVLAIFSILLNKLSISVLYGYALLVLPYAVIAYAALDILSGIFKEKKKFREYIFNIAVIITLWLLCM